jgi:hypothetical protein
LALSLKDFEDVRPKAPPGLTIWDNNGWAIRAYGGDREVLLWLSPYYLRGGRSSPYVVDEASTWQTVLVTAKRGLRRMRANEFIADGWYMSDLRPAEALRIRREAGAVIWELDGSKITCSPPTWLIDHRRPGLEVQLAVTGTSPPIRIERGTEPGADYRWHMLQGRVTGFLRLGRRLLRLRGFAHHERHTHLSESYDPARNKKGEGIWWLAAFSKLAHVFIQARPSLGVYRAWVSRGRQMVQVKGASRISFEATEKWLDPASQVLVPCSWRVRIKDKVVHVDMTMSSTARAYYLWSYLTNSYTLAYWWLTIGEGQIKVGAQGPGHTKFRGFAHLNRVFLSR